MFPSLLAYLGPDSMLPVASLASVLLGILLLGWRTLRRGLSVTYRWLLARVTRSPITPHQPSPPPRGQEWGA